MSIVIICIILLFSNVEEITAVFTLISAHIFMSAGAKPCLVHTSIACSCYISRKEVVFSLLRYVWTNNNLASFVILHPSASYALLDSLLSER